jgi:peroxiredoxin
MFHRISIERLGTRLRYDTHMAKRLFGPLMFTLLVTVSIAAQTPAKIDVMTRGPQIGQAAPDFRLVDQRGHTWTRDSLMGPNGLMLVFSRSADWCPYCKTQMIELQSRAEEIKSRGLGLAVITYDSPAILADFTKRRGITYALLSDAGSTTIKNYGILNTTVEATSTNYGIPFPGTFILNTRGAVTAKFFEEAYQERTTVSNIMLKLGEAGAGVAARRISTGQLDVTTYASDQVVAPGSLFSLVFDVVPHQGIHVYAPGPHNYKVIGIRLDPNPVVMVRPVRYPASETYVFAPLKERVEVYQKPFRLLADVAIDASREARPKLASVDSVTITGTLDYQACDERLCFTPKSVPISYTVKLRQLDTERASGGAPR